MPRRSALCAVGGRRRSRESGGESLTPALRPLDVAWGREVEAAGEASERRKPQRPRRPNFAARGHGSALLFRRRGPRIGDGAEGAAARAAMPPALAEPREDWPQTARPAPIPNQAHHHGGPAAAARPRPSPTIPPRGGGGPAVAGVGRDVLSARPDACMGGSGRRASAACRRARRGARGRAHPFGVTAMLSISRTSSLPAPVWT